MSRLIDLRRQQFELFIRHPDQHVTPVIAMRKTPHGRAENVVFPARRAREESAAAQRVGQPKGATAVNPQQFRKLSQRNRLFGESDRLQNSEPAIKTLDKRNLSYFFLCHNRVRPLFLGSRLPAACTIRKPGDAEPWFIIVCGGVCIHGENSRVCIWFVWTGDGWCDHQRESYRIPRCAVQAIECQGKTRLRHFSAELRELPQ